jgi:hypothetical protein
MAVIAVAWWFRAPTTSPVVAQQADRTAGLVITHSRASAIGDLHDSVALGPETEDGLAAEELWGHLSDPTDSDLPPELFAHLTEIATAVVRADATGEGREAWPGYWYGEALAPRADPCCTEVEIRAASALRIDGSLTRARVLITWSGQREELVPHQVTTVIMLTSHEGEWIPVR